jgi:predicted ATP-grasp superfamily ATP-dependent carboligase
MQGVKQLKSLKLRNPHLVVAWPGMGEVAYKAATYLIESLKAQEFARIAPQDFFYLTGSTVEQGILALPELPYGKFYYWKNPAARVGKKSDSPDLIIFTSSAQPDLVRAEAYCEKIIDFIKTMKVKKVIGFAAMPQPIDHTHKPQAWFSATNPRLNETLKQHSLRLLSTGQISGLNGLFLGVAKKKGIEGLCLLGEIPLYTIQIDNPKGSYAVLEAFSRIFGIRLDLSGLLKQAQAMDEEINKLLEYLHLNPPSSGPISEEEIEKIKKSLSQFTKLPISVKERIEKMFEATRVDIGKAGELKAELDKWNAYKDYEDRFLDLFKKAKNKDN